MVRTAIDGVATLSAKSMCFDIELQLVSDPVNCVVVGFGSGSLTAARMACRLTNQNPQILTIVHGDGLMVAANEMTDEQACDPMQPLCDIAERSLRNQTPWKDCAETL